MKSSLLLSVALPCIALSAPVALAQEETPLRQQTVIVSLPGPQRDADELIGNATSMDRDDIIENLSASLGDTLDREPGVSSTFFGAGASRPVLRGLGAERVLVLTNGIGAIDVSAASPDHQVAADGIDAEKIEILRGPAALAYGGQAIGGVVNVIDGLISETLPTSPLSGEAYAAYDSVFDGPEAGAKIKASAGQFVFAASASMRDFNAYDIPGSAESDQFHALEEAESHDHEEEEGNGTLPNSFVETGTLAGGISWVGDTSFLGLPANLDLWPARSRGTWRGRA